MEKNIIVQDENGNEIGRTYPKRAKGLVKNGRALFVDDLIIRLLTTCPTEIIKQEDFIGMNNILFNTREWKKNAESLGNSERSFMTVFDEMKEVYSVGSVNSEVAEIATVKELEPNTDYSFVFWMSGGESDAYNEICQLQIVYSNGDFTEDEIDDKSVYRLNREYIKPVKKVKGWKLFCIPFNTEDEKYVQLKFVVANAEALFMKAEVEAEEEAKEDKMKSEDIMSTVSDYAKKVGDSAVKLGSKAVELGKKYKEPAKELGEKGLNGIKSGAEKVKNSDAFKKFEDMVTNLVSGNKEEKAEETASEAQAEETTEETIETTVETAAEAVEEAVVEETVETTEDTNE